MPSRATCTLNASHLGFGAQGDSLFRSLVVIPRHAVQLVEAGDRFGSAAIKRAVLLGRDRGSTMPLLPG